MKIISIYNFFILILCLKIVRNNLEEIENYEVNIYESLVKKVKFQYPFNTLNTEIDRKFLNGIVRKYKPKKLLEIGVAQGVSSMVLLNAINDIEDAILYSIDLTKEIPIYKNGSVDFSRKQKTKVKVGYFVDEYGSDLKKKWKTYFGGYYFQFVEEIGKDIDFVFLDTIHELPGEVLDFLQILPFLKDNAIIVIHDINYNRLDNIRSSNDILFTYLRGKKIIPKPTEEKTIHNIGAVLLEKNQSNFYFDYFFATTLHWHYVPNEKVYSLLVKFFEKYYEKICIDIFKEAYLNNKKLLESNNSKYIKFKEQRPKESL